MAGSRCESGAVAPLCSRRPVGGGKARPFIVTFCPTGARDPEGGSVTSSAPPEGSFLVTAVDGCPGILDLHQARDGHVARIRLPGGYATGPRLRGLAALASRFGDGCVALTARGNGQVRGGRRGAARALARPGAVGGAAPRPAPGPAPLSP